MKLNPLDLTPSLDPPRHRLNLGDLLDARAAAGIPLRLAQAQMGSHAEASREVEDVFQVAGAQRAASRGAEAVLVADALKATVGVSPEAGEAVLVGDVLKATVGVSPEADEAVLVGDVLREGAAAVVSPAATEDLDVSDLVARAIPPAALSAVPVDLAAHLETPAPAGLAVADSLLKRLESFRRTGYTRACGDLFSAAYSYCRYFTVRAYACGRLAHISGHH